ncbi:MAG TPA: hypothetical protein VGB55_09990 [Tepidisphaeraceae bacterium]|jgi:hypothetical protein
MTSSGKWAAVVWGVATLAVIVAAGLAGWWIIRPDPITQSAGPATGPATLVTGDDYYFFVRLVEFKRTNFGDKWDSGNSSAPDAQVILHWRGNRVFELPERPDQLIATWDLFRVDVKQLITSGGEIDITGAINAPLIKAGPDEKVTIEVWDSDTMSRDELALKMDIPLAPLTAGVNAITLPKDCGLERLEVQLIDRRTPLPQLLELASRR